MIAYSIVDVFAVGFFILEWTVYAVTLEHTAYGRDSLSARMNAYREVWIRRMLDREARMVDMQIMASLQNGTAFFASTTLLAVGGALALLRATSEAMPIIEKLPIGFNASPALWENQMRRIAADLRLRVLQIRLVIPAVQLRRHPARRDAAGVAARRAASGGACDPHHQTVSGRGTAFQPRPARVFLRARLPRLVRQPLGAAGINRRRGHRHLAPAIRLQRLARDGKLD